MDEQETAQGEKVVDQMVAYVQRALELGADAVLVQIREPATTILMGVRVDRSVIEPGFPEGQQTVGAVANIAEGREAVHEALARMGFRPDDIAGVMRYLMAFQADVASQGLHFRVASVRRHREGAAPWRPDIAFPPVPPPEVRL